MEIFQSIPLPPQSDVQSASMSVSGTDGGIKSDPSGKAPLFDQLFARFAGTGAQLQAAEGQSIDLIMQSDGAPITDKTRQADSAMPENPLLLFLGKTGDQVIQPQAMTVVLAEEPLPSLPEETKGEVKQEAGSVDTEKADEERASQGGTPDLLQTVLQMSPILPHPAEGGGSEMTTGTKPASGLEPLQKPHILTESTVSPMQNDGRVSLQKSEPSVGDSGIKTAQLPQTAGPEAAQKGRDVSLSAMSADMEAQEAFTTAKQPERNNTAIPAEILEVQTKAGETSAAPQKASAESLLSRSTVIPLQEMEQAARPARPSTAAGTDVGIDPSQVEVVIQDMAVKEVAASTDAEMKSGAGDKGNDNPAQSVLSSAHGSAKAPENQLQPPTQAETGKPGDHERILAQVKEKLAVHEPLSGNGQITLKLHPAELGELKINVQMVDQRLKVEIVAQNQNVKEALMQNLDSLKETLSRQNIAMDGFDVSTGGQGSSQAFKEGRQAAQARYYPPFAQNSGFGKEEEEMRVSYWQPRENSLVDVRF